MLRNTEFGMPRASLHPWGDGSRAPAGARGPPARRGGRGVGSLRLCGSHREGEGGWPCPYDACKDASPLHGQEAARVLQGLEGGPGYWALGTGLDGFVKVRSELTPLPLGLNQLVVGRALSSRRCEGPGLLCCKLFTDIERGSLCCTVCVLKQEPEKEARRPCLGSVCPAPRGTEASPARKLDGTGGWRQTDSTQTLISARVRATGLASVPSRASVRPVGLPVSVSPNPEPAHWNFPIRRARGNRRSTQSESKFPGGGPSGSPAVDADASWVPSKIVAGAAKGVSSEPSHPHRQQE
uniref:Uncharacterized protein LOC123615420 n=1 Tax=Camelus bactrianus TaxID=9837 RepID=A0A9W3HDI7_CAMBA|nr:uncharacterized protein LOC123615420 [Camelus bactrianus]